VYLVIKKKESFIGFKPLSPKKLKLAIIDLGASFIKLAQVLATRADFFSTQYLDELRDLHDQLPMMKREEFEYVYQKAELSGLFQDFDHIAIASASIGQVHSAILLDGTKVAVKLRRFQIEKQVHADVVIINFFNKLFRPLFSHTTKNSIEAVVSEFSKMIKEEVSLKNELANLEKFSAVYAKSGIKFPIPYRKYCSDDALIMSFEEGFRFDDKENIFKHKIDFRAIIKKLVNFYMEQMLLKGYFHADPHPGNLLVNTQGELILLDFGMVKTVPNKVRVAIIELIKAANEQDYERYIEANKKLGTIAYEAPVSQLAEFASKMFTIFSNENLTSESMQQLAFEVMESTRDLPFKLPSDAIYILRVSAIIEGLGTTYIENFNGVKDILPILQQNIPKALGAKESVLETLINEIKEIPFVVKDLKNAVKQIATQSLHVELDADQLDWIFRHFKREVKSYAVAFSLLLSGFFLLILDNDYKNIAIALFVIGILKIFYK
jgi:predicted unusual protein kinase regulating ubiquinone biosynthesis (AarF/ABC1/UbiB family)